MENTDEKIVDEILENIRHGDAEAVRKLEELAANGNARAMSNLATVFFKGLGGVESSYKKAAELFEKAAALDEVFALATLGRFYRDSKCGFEQNGHKATEFFIRAAKLAVPKGAAMCLRSAAEIYHYGQGGVAPDGRKAVALYEKLADLESRGEVEITFSRDKALFRIADIYANGCGNLAPNAKKAVEYLNKAAERGDEQSALYELAKFYREGKAGLKPDGYKVIEYLARLGDLKGIAEIYRDGKFGIQASGIKAVEYLTKEIERDKGKSLDEIADWYLKNGSGNDMNDANVYLSDLEEICNVYTFEKIAQIFLDGRGGLNSDGQRALEYFFKAEEALDNAINFTKTFVELNRPNVLRRIFRWGRRCKKDICRKIAEIFLEGRGGIPVDGYKAIEHFDKASSFYKVAEIYRYGKAGVKINPQKAVEYLLRYVDEICRNHKSANTADNVDSFIDNENRAEAFRGIAEIYLTLADGERALEYFLKADECGDEWAYINVAQLYRKGKGNLKPDGVKFIEYLTKKLKQNEDIADMILCDIGEAYEDGCGTLEPNLQKALEFYRKSAALGNNDAKIKIAKLCGTDE